MGMPSKGWLSGVLLGLLTSNGAQESTGAGGVSVIAVTVENGCGEPVVGGVLEYFAGGSECELSTGALRGTLRLDGSCRTIVLPATAAEVYVVASAPGCRVGARRLSHLRKVDGGRQRTGRIDRCLKLQLEADEGPAGELLTGQVTVEGRAGPPRDLCILVHPGSAPLAPGQRSASEVADRLPKLASFDPLRGTYEVELGSSIASLLVCSAETVPQRFAVGWTAGDRVPTVDLRLDPGRTMSVAVGTEVGDPLPWQQLLVERTVRIETDEPDRVATRVDHFLAQADANGRLLLCGLPREGAVSLFDTLDHELRRLGRTASTNRTNPASHAASALLARALAPDRAPAAASVRCSSRPAETLVWGHVVGLASGAEVAPRLRFRLRGSPPVADQERAVEVVDGTWSARLPRAASMTVRFGCGSALSEEYTLHLVTEALGPIALELRDGALRIPIDPP